MLYYSRTEVAGPHSGALSLTSPPVDLTSYKDVKIHFDYMFRGNTLPSISVVPSFRVEVFDGSTWMKVFERKAERPMSAADIYGSNIWDSIPSRLFIDLEPYKNKTFQVRFIADDGSQLMNRSWLIFTALDNIRIDGYKEKMVNDAGEWQLFPNPAQTEVFVKGDPQWMSQPLTYRLLDVSGRLLGKGALNGYRINLEGLSQGIYIIQLFSKEGFIGSKKIMKN